MGKVIWYLLKGLLYLTAFVVMAVLAMIALFIYVIFALVAEGTPAIGYGYMIGYSDSTFKRWWWWRRWRNN